MLYSSPSSDALRTTLACSAFSFPSQLGCRIREGARQGVKDAAAARGWWNFLIWTRILHTTILFCAANINLTLNRSDSVFYDMCYQSMCLKIAQM